MKRALGLAAILLLIGLTAAAWAGPRDSVVAKLLPQTNEIKGWSIIPRTFQYGKGDGLTEIYNGGYQLYTENGVIEAAREIYQRKDELVVVTIHRHSTQTAANKFYDYWKKSYRGQPAFRPLKAGEAMFAALPVASMAYGCARISQYLVITELTSKGNTRFADSATFVRTIHRKLKSKDKG